MSTREGRLLAFNAQHLQSTHNQMPLDARQTAVEILDAAVASAMDLSLAALQAKWNARGADFRSLDRLFAGMARELEAIATTLAERAAALGGIPRGTAQSVAVASRLKPFPVLSLDSREHAAELALRAAELATEFRQSIYELERHDDPVTTRLLTVGCTRIEELLWRLEASLPPVGAETPFPTRSR